MPIAPLLPGRIPSSLLASRLQQDLFRNSLLLSTLQEQAATGQKLFLPSDSPAAAIRSLVNQRQLEYQDQYKTTISTDSGYLSASDQSLQTISDLLNHTKALLLQGVGDTVSSTERSALADEVSSIIHGAVNAANTTYNGRYLFGGSQSSLPPFEITGDNVVNYQGDRLSIDTLIEQHLRVGNSVDGATAFGVLNPLPSKDIDPALSAATKLSDLYQGAGVEPGIVEVTLQSGATVQKVSVDLSSAQTIGDVRTRLEQAFAGGPLTLAVDIDPSTNSGLRLTPSAGTVAVADVAGGRIAADFGIASTGAAVITGGDVNPRLTEQTRIADLNGGAGIGPVAGTGLQITLGDEVKTIDLSSAVTVEDLFNAIRQSGLAVNVGINDDGTGLAISTRASGVDFSIGENGGVNATQLGIRTFTSDTLLSDLNHGRGVPVDDGTPLEITRRDGSTVQIDLAGAKTVQDVLDAINAVDPGVLAASLNSVGNGISITDNDGVSTGPLQVAENVVSTGLGINGEETGTDPTVPLTGRDTNPQESGGLFNILSRLENALRNGDDAELTRLDGLLNREVGRFNLVRGEIGSRLQRLDDVKNRILDRDVLLKQSLSDDFDTDLTETVTQVSQVQTALQATLQIASRTSQLSLLSFL